MHMWSSLLPWLIALLPVLPTFSKPHPFYVGVVEVAHNKGAATLELSCKLFAEDIEAALEQQYKTSLDLTQSQQKATIDRLLADYVQKHLLVQAGGRAQPLRFLGFEQETESLYCYFEASGVRTVKTVVLRNSLLYDLTDKQVNIMHVVVDGVRKSYKLDYPDTQASFTF